MDDNEEYPLYVPVAGTFDEFDSDEPENSQVSGWGWGTYFDVLDEYSLTNLDSEFERSVYYKDVNEKDDSDEDEEDAQDEENDPEEESDKKEVDKKKEDTIKESENKELLNILYAWRYDIATRFNVESERIIRSQWLHLISAKKPTSLSELKFLGIPLAKRFTYGDVILDIIQKYTSGEILYYNDYVRKTITLRYRLDFDFTLSYPRCMASRYSESFGCRENRHTSRVFNKEDIKVKTNY